ncbi:polyprenyl diphosphate synthase [Youngiibacter fragilis]|uniref:Isoprenyl transferase n=1 Tax=Youngiibacter fragilis 232.1 TaxID=994573 RepID=V7I668_9CLOT|nr:polyprenyl diphosphate synthase [Youngiibacter fragilis]ETA81705.1 UDP pyrophosphate synthase [Youngiibacter fragilis 232.1]
MNQISVPNHLAIIVDGNRRWARKHHMPAFMGHKHGFDRLEKIIDHAVKSGVSYISLFVFSTENFRRDANEVDYLMELFCKNFSEMAAKMKRKNIKVVFSGRRTNLIPSVIDAMNYLSSETQDCTQSIVNFCLNYGGRAEIVDACKAISADVDENTLQIEDINETTFTRYLYQDLPPVDFLVRTSGEIRISNFMLWQLAYAEMYFTDVLFPDFDEACFDEALRVYQCRSRRFGVD